VAAGHGAAATLASIAAFFVGWRPPFRLRCAMRAILCLAVLCVSLPVQAESLLATFDASFTDIQSDQPFGLSVEPFVYGGTYNGWIAMSASQDGSQRLTRDVDLRAIETAMRKPACYWQFTANSVQGGWSPHYVSFLNEIVLGSQRLTAVELDISNATHRTVFTDPGEPLSFSYVVYSFDSQLRLYSIPEPSAFVLMTIPMLLCSSLYRRRSGRFCKACR
jgi:hypothetical protein